jgi:UDP-N-acetylglucosamine 2-epimerase (hydrolysing)
MHEARTRILFLTGTRADFGKLKPLLSSLQNRPEFEVFIFTTGMHMLRRYGSTWEEVERANLGRVYMFVNQNSGDSMDAILAKTVSGLSDLVKEIEPDLVVVHGDRVEALAGAIVGTFNRRLVAHIEGGEVSGTLDETIRHTVTKLSHLHFVSNDEAANRLLQLGEHRDSIFVVGSPEVDVMSSPNLPSLDEVRRYYGFDFADYGLLIFHPVTTELEEVAAQAKTVVDYVLDSGRDFVAILPNNDDGTQLIQAEYARFGGSDHVRLLPSMRFEYYLTTLRHAGFILGNSSSGVREAAYFGVPSVNLGSRQANRSRADSVIDCNFDVLEIKSAVRSALECERIPQTLFGDGRSGERFLEILAGPVPWSMPVQKAFIDRPVVDVSKGSSDGAPC